MKKLLFLSLLAIFPLSASAQSASNAFCNRPHHGDRIIKQQVLYQEAGKDYINFVWDFSLQESIDEKHELSYAGIKAITGEHRTMYYYRTHGDSVLLQECPPALITYLKPEALVVFPFPYGCTFSDHFNGIGHYGNQTKIHLQGKSIVTDDASGQILLSRSVRYAIHTLKKTIKQMIPIFFKKPLPTDTLPFILCPASAYHLAGNSLRMEIETWHWSVEGYRYLLFETIKSSVYQHNCPREHFATSFYYPAHEQYYDLKSDPYNQEKRDETTEKEREWISFDKERRCGSLIKPFFCNFQIDEQANIHVNYPLCKLNEVTISLDDIQNRQTLDS